MWFDCGVYLIRNTVNGKVYVGSSNVLSTRWKRHLWNIRAGTHPNLKLTNAFKKYGETAFEFEVIAYCPETDLLWQEQLALDAFQAFRHGYNMASIAGSPMRCRKHSDATKEKMSADRKGIPKPFDFGLKLSKARQGIKMPPGTGARAWATRHLTLIKPEISQMYSNKLAAFNASPEGRTKASVRSRRNWCNEAYRNAQVEAIKASESRPELKEQRRNTAKAFNKMRTPEFNAWCARKRAASYMGLPFNEVKPDMYLSIS